jgi:hypothetical protein
LALLLNRDLGPYQRVAVLSEANDRVILGAGLHRRLVLLSPGGRAHEEVFGQPDAVLIHYMNTDRVVPGLTNPPDPQASAALNAALIKSGVQAAVTGGGFVNPPPDWRPPAGWCTAGTAQTATLYLDRATARPGACPAA